MNSIQYTHDSRAYSISLNYSHTMRICEMLQRFVENIIIKKTSGFVQVYPSLRPHVCMRYTQKPVFPTSNKLLIQFLTHELQLVMKASK